MPTPIIQHWGRGTVTGSTAVASVTNTPRWCYYTGCTSNATTSSRTRIDVDLTVGSAVVYDPVGGNATTPIAASATTGFPGDFVERYPGFTVTRPETALLENFAGIVWNVPIGSVRGGLVQIVSLSEYLNARVTTAGAASAGTFLAITDGSFILTDMPALGSVTNATTMQAAVISIIKRAVAKVQTPISGAITDTLSAVSIGPVGTGD